MIRRGEGGWVDVGRAFMVARCWWCDRVPPTGEHREQDAGDHKGPPIGINLSPERAWDGQRVDRPQAACDAH